MFTQLRVEFDREKNHGTFVVIFNELKKQYKNPTYLTTVILMLLSSLKAALLHISLQLKNASPQLKHTTSIQHFQVRGVNIIAFHKTKDVEEDV